MDIYTIGHSNQTWEPFSRLLKVVGIELLVDVRSRPYSRWAVFANKTRLPELLASERIDYAFMGDALGGKPADQALYDAGGLPDYALIAKSESFRQGLRRLKVLAKESTTAIMCSEEDPSKCHRRLLIEPCLTDMGIGVLHIRKDGRVSNSLELENERSRTAVVQGEFSITVDRDAP